MEHKNENYQKDIEILKKGSICKYFKQSILNDDIVWFENRGYEIIQINTKNWTSSNFYKNIKDALNFPDYFGENLNAFKDNLSDLFHQKNNGLVIVFNDYKLAEVIIDIIADESRLWFIEGKKLFAFLQSNNPHLELPKIG